jgi:hypothetical protein
MKKIIAGFFVLLACQVACPTFAHAFNKEKGTYHVDSSGVVIGKKKSEKVKKEKKPKK